ncbi:MAG: WXG100 family type VII secretion target [Actinobacteria bacterium]|nr:WXG100 family type VII secretion target [Actinomycetota bacterium]
MIEGAQVEELERLARRLKVIADTLRTAESQLSGDVRRVDWRGSRSTAFKTAWHSRYAPQLRQHATLLRASSEALSAQAAAQRTASAPNPSLGSVVPNPNLVAGALSGVRRPGTIRVSPEAPPRRIVNDRVWLNIMGVEGEAELTMEDRGDGTSTATVRVHGAFGTGLEIGAVSRTWDETEDRIVGAYGGVSGESGQYVELTLSMDTANAAHFLKNPDRSLALGLADIAADKRIDAVASKGSAVLDGMSRLPLISHVPGFDRLESTLRLTDDGVRLGKEMLIADVDGPGSPSDFTIETVRQGSVVAGSAMFAVGTIPSSGGGALRLEADPHVGLPVNPSMRGEASGSFDFSTALGRGRRVMFTTSVEGATATPPLMQRQGISAVLSGRATTQVTAAEGSLEVKITTVSDNIATVATATVNDATTPQALRLIAAMQRGDEAAVLRGLAELDGEAVHGLPVRYAVTGSRGHERAIEVGVGYGDGRSHTRWDLLDD